MPTVPGRVAQLLATLQHSWAPGEPKSQKHAPFFWKQHVPGLSLVSALNQRHPAPSVLVLGVVEGRGLLTGALAVSQCPAVGLPGRC